MVIIELLVKEGLFIVMTFILLWPVFLGLHLYFLISRNQTGAENVIQHLKKKSLVHSF